MARDVTATNETVLPEFTSLRMELSWIIMPGILSATATVVPFESFHVTDPSDTAAVINAKLVEGLHIVVTPGVYELEDSLEIKQENQVVR